MDRKKILVADDEPGVRLTVVRMLEKDYYVIEANDGEEAVKAAEEQKPDLIFMDLMMPKMDGYTACSKIRNNATTSGIPVVMLTAIGHDLNKKFASEMGADGYITKPFERQDLLDTINKFTRSTSQSS